MQFFLETLVCVDKETAKQTEELKSVHSPLLLCFLINQ